MILMSLLIPLTKIVFLSVITLTSSNAIGARIEIPPCPEGTERQFYPSGNRPIWASCKDSKGLYQGLLIQFSSQTEIIRIASMKDSLRDGREIRFGAPGTLEERSFKDGHLDGPSFVYPSEVPVGRLFPKAATTEDWAKFTQASKDSILKPWIKKDPQSQIDFNSGRLSGIQFGTTHYQFQISKDGRIFALNHPEMRGQFFIDPEALWDLNAADLKALLTPGFGTCKKYSGPIGRFGRHYDTLLFKKMPTEKKHLERLTEIRDRFIDFCIPKDLQAHLGKMECPPQLPSAFPPRYCPISISDQIHIPYDPKYFKFEFSLGHAPEHIAQTLKTLGVTRFLSTMDQTEDGLSLSKDAAIQLKKTPDGLKFLMAEKDKEGKIKFRKPAEGGKEGWWEWHRIPGL